MKFNVHILSIKKNTSIAIAILMFFSPIKSQFADVNTTLCG